MSASQPGISPCGDPVFIVAEAGVNHNGSLDTALELVRVAADCGADAVKFQSFQTDELVTADAGVAEYQRKTGAHSQRDLLLALELPWKAQEELASECSRLDIEFMSTPFDTNSLDFLVNEVSMQRVKVASPDLTNGPLLLAASRTGRDLILSTGMGNLYEIDRALALIAFGMTHAEGQPTDSVFRLSFGDSKGAELVRERVTLLHCTSAYPAPLIDVNLRAMATLKTQFGLEVGYSDHTEGDVVALAAAALGATVVEKHFTLDQTMPGPDHAASLEPDGLAEMIAKIRHVETALGSTEKGRVASEQDVALVSRRSIVAARAIAAGELLSPDNLAVRRPGTGRSPMEYWDLLGTRAERAYEPGDLL